MSRFSNLKKRLTKRVDFKVPVGGKFGNWLNRDANLMPKYFKDSYRELQKVTWPSRKDTWKLFVAVMVFAIVMAAIIAAADVLFEEIIERTIL